MNKNRFDISFLVKIDDKVLNDIWKFGKITGSKIVRNKKKDRGNQDNAKQRER